MSNGRNSGSTTDSNRKTLRTRKGAVCLAATAGALAALANSAAYAVTNSYTWATGDSTGVWSSTSTTTDWSSLTYPNSAGSIVKISAASGHDTVTLDVNATVGQITPGATSGGSAFSINNNSIGIYTLTMDGTGVGTNALGVAGAADISTGSSASNNNVNANISMYNTDLDIGANWGSTASTNEVTIGIAGAGTTLNNAGSTGNSAATHNLNFVGPGSAVANTVVNIASNIGTTGAGIYVTNQINTGNVLLSGTLGPQVLSVTENSTSSSQIVFTAASAAYTGPIYAIQGGITANSNVTFNNLTLGPTSTASTVGSLNLNGLTITVDNLTLGAGGNSSQGVVTNNGAAAATLVYSGGGTDNFGGSIQNGAKQTALTVNYGTLNLTGANSYNGSTTVTYGGTLGLTFSGTSATTNIIAPTSALVLGGGAVNVAGLSSSSTQAFASTTLSTGTTSSVSVTGNAAVALGTFSSLEGSSIVLNGPTTINGSGAVTATGTITTTSTGLTGGLLAYAAQNDDYATVGQYDWAATSAGSVVGGSAISGFYTADVNNTTPATGVNWDMTAQQTPTGIGGTTNNGRVSATGTDTVDSVRFNSGHAPYVTVKGGIYFESGGVLVTPNMGSVNSAIDGFRLAGTGIQLVQNNTSALLVIGTNYSSAGVATGGPFFSNAANATENVVKSGSGTLLLDPTAYAAPVNYLNSSSVLTTVASKYYEYGNSASGSYYALFLNGGVTVIDNPNVLGNPTSQATTYGAGGTVNLNGGTLLDNSNSINLINANAASANRPVWLGGSGGGLAAAAGMTLTVNGPVQSNAGYAPLIIGIPASTANSGIAGLVPGTGGSTANPAINATGTVALTGGNSYVGGTIVDSGTLQINGVYALGGLYYGGLTLNGGTLQFAPGSAGVTNGSVNGSLDVSNFVGKGLYLGTGGGTVDVQNNVTSFTGNITGPGLLAVTGTTGSLQLSGGSAYSGGTNINAGKVIVSNTTGSATGTGPVNLTGGTLAGSGSITGVVNLSGGTIAPGVAGTALTLGAVNYNSGTIGAVLNGAGSGTSSVIDVTNATFNAVPTFSLTGSNLVTGESFTILSSTNTIADNGHLAGLSSITVGRAVLVPSESASGNSIIMTVQSSSANLVWAGAVSGLGTSMAAQGDGSTWNNTQTTGASNFNNGGKYDYFYDADSVTFNGTGASAVNITTTVSPTAVYITGGAYTFSGSGSIGGAGSVNVSAGTLTLSTSNNNYSGGTTIGSTANVVLGAANALPTAGSITVQGTLDLAGNVQTIAGLSDGGASASVITNTGSSSTLTLSNSTATSAFSGTVSGNLALQVTTPGQTLTLSGANTFNGGTTVSAGTLTAASNSALGSGAVLLNPATLLTSTVNFTSASPIINSLASSGAGTSKVVLGNTAGTPTLLTLNTTGTTTFGGVISDLSATNSLAVGSLTIAGTGTQILTGSNTYTGQTIVGGSGATLTLGNSLAIQNSTLNYNGQGGNVSFGTLTAATFGGLNGSQGLALTNTASAGVTLTAGGNNASTTYSGVLSGAGSFVKAGTGTMVLSGVNTYTGNTSSSAGVLTITGTIGGGSSLGGVTAGINSTINVDGGTVNASYFNTDAHSGSSTVNVINGGSITAATMLLNADNGSTGFSFNVINGTVTAGSIIVDRSGSALGPLTTDPNSGGLIINGTNAVVHVTGNLGLDTSGANTANNSNAYVVLDAGTLNVDGSTTISLAGSGNRSSAVDIVGGTFNATGGVQIGSVNNASYFEFMVHGGVTNTSGITFGSSAQLSGTNTLLLGGGTLYLGSGGIVNSSGTGTTNIISLGSTAFTGAPVLAASADWTSSMDMTLTNNSGVAPTIKLADAAGVAHNIGISGNLTGTGGLTIAGSGVLTLSPTTANTYSGPTVITSGTLVAGTTTALSPNSAYNINGGTLDVTAAANTISSLNMSPTGTLNLSYGTVLAVTNAASFDGYLNLIGATTSSTVPQTLITYASSSGTFPTAKVTGVPTGDSLVYIYNGINELELVATASGPSNLLWTGATSGNWNVTDSNWTKGGTPTAYSDTSASPNAGDNVAFNDGSGVYNITINNAGASVKPSSVTFNNSLNNYNISGSGVGIAGAGSVTLKGTGTVTFTSTNSYTGGTNVSAGKLILGSAGAFPNNGSNGTALTIGSGAVVQVTAHTGSTSYEPIISSLTNGGLIDITNNEMLFKNASLTTISGEVSAAYNTNGTWKTTGNGLITSSTVGGLTTVGVGTVGSDVLVKATYYGDATLDGQVNSADYTIIDSSYLTQQTAGNISGWQNGDFNYDGVVNGSDYTLIDNAFNMQGAQLSAQIASPTAQLAGGASAVPEPTSLALLGIGALGLLGRRRRAAAGFASVK